MHLQQLQQAQTAQKQTTYAANAAVTTISKWWNCSIKWELLENKDLMQLLSRLKWLVPATWEAVLPRESNGQINAANAW